MTKLIKIKVEPEYIARLVYYVGILKGLSRWLWTATAELRQLFSVEPTTLVKELRLASSEKIDKNFLSLLIPIMEGLQLDCKEPTIYINNAYVEHYCMKYISRLVMSRTQIYNLNNSSAFLSNYAVLEFNEEEEAIIPDHRPDIIRPLLSTILKVAQAKFDQVFET